MQNQTQQPTLASTADDSLQIGQQSSTQMKEALPIFYKHVTQWDIEQSPLIKKILMDDYNQYEVEGDRKRIIVMNELNQIVKLWIMECGRQMGVDEDQVRTWGGKIFEFGSYRLGVHTPTTDIDALCVAPCQIDRDRHFFGILPQMLLDRKDQGVEKLITVREAFVPCIKMIYKGVDIDLLFARIEHKQIGENFDSLKDDYILRNCDSEDIKSLNGRRATDAILDHIPNRETFQLTLRCVKLWAKNRGIYSNVFGYCGGVAWAILVAYVCKHNPDLETCQLLDTFFRFYRMRQWQYDNPIFLGEIKNNPNHVYFTIDDQMLFYKPNERGDFFPIITPAFPSMNSTYNVSLTTRNIMITELEKAMEITKHMMSQKHNTRITWKRLFKKFPFFKAYQHFIQIQILSKNEELHQKWKGYVESKIRRLLQHLEVYNNHRPKRCCMEFRPWPQAYQLENKIDQGFEQDDTYYFGIRLKRFTENGENKEDPEVQAEEENADMQQMDLTDIREKFFEKIKQFIQDPAKTDQMYLDDMNKKHIDIDIQCLDRDQLPEKVRPQISNTRQSKISIQAPQMMNEYAHYNNISPEQRGNGNQNQQQLQQQQDYGHYGQNGGGSNFQSYNNSGDQMQNQQQQQVGQKRSFESMQQTYTFDDIEEINYQ